MKTTRTVRILTLIALIIGICGAGWHPDQDESVLAELQATLTITQPDGVDDVVGEGDDFATTVFGDPWDMSQATDVLALHYLSGATFSSGVLSYNVQSSPSDRVGFLFPGMPGAMNVGKIGVNYPIDTNLYRWISFRMMQPAGHVLVAWYYNQELSQGATTGFMPVTPGWHTYVVDLGSNADWKGQVLGLYLVSNALAGTQVMIDWVRLTADNPTGNSLDIAWSGLSPIGGTVDFYLDSDDTGCNGPLIHTESNAQASGSFTWQQPANGVASPANVASGDYYVCAMESGSFAGRSAGQLTVNQSPIVHFTQPSFTGGDDYATDAGNPWDISDAGDIASVVNGTPNVSGGILAVTVPGSASDVQVYLNVPTAIDSDRYHYLTYRLWFDYDYTWIDVGQGSRIFWGREPLIETQSGWIYDYPGWQTYSLDLRSLDLSFGPGWSTADWTKFRLDPIANGTGETVTFYIDDVKLTGDEQADQFADIRWQVTDPDTSVTSMDIYYDEDESGLDGTLIASLTLMDGQRSAITMVSTVAADPSLGVTDALTPTIFLPLVVHNWGPACTGACYTWDTSTVAPGVYYLYACLNDGYNEVCRYSERPLHISHP
jgi:hypothetical protein